MSKLCGKTRYFPNQAPSSVHEGGEMCTKYKNCPLHLCFSVCFWPIRHPMRLGEFLHFYTYTYQAWSPLEMWNTRDRFIKCTSIVKLQPEHAHCNFVVLIPNNMSISSYIYFPSLYHVKENVILSIQWISFLSTLIPQPLSGYCLFATCIWNLSSIPVFLPHCNWYRSKDLFF